MTPGRCYAKAFFFLKKKIKESKQERNLKFRVIDSSLKHTLNQSSRRKGKRGNS